MFFGRELRDVSLAEAATLAGMIQSPAHYSPVRHAEAARTRRNIVLAAMQQNGWITQEQYTAASAEPTHSCTCACFDNSLAPYFVDYVNRLAESERQSANLHNHRSRIAASSGTSAETAVGPSRYPLRQSRRKTAGRARCSRSAHRQCSGNGWWTQLRRVTTESSHGRAPPAGLDFQAFCLRGSCRRRNVAGADVYGCAERVCLRPQQDLSAGELWRRILHGPGHDAHGFSEIAKRRHS